MSWDEWVVNMSWDEWVVQYELGRVGGRPHFQSILVNLVISVLMVQ